MTVRRVCILVKAYPQPSQQYEETVCCAGVTDTGEFLRLYPIPYRRLKPEQRFDRYDLVEMKTWKSESDHRPESYKVDSDSIRIIQKGTKLKAAQKVRLWLPFVTDSLTALKEENCATGRSLGIIKPDTGSVRFKSSPFDQGSEEDRSLAMGARQQASLFHDTPLKELKVDYQFSYKFTSGGVAHDMKIHDWEVQATYHNFSRKYGSDTLRVMAKEYGENIPAKNLHLIMGTMKAHPRQFIIIGLLRSEQDVDALRSQTTLLGF
jgi:hypothetical protein